jgi:antitoxin component YwqK of YwqJK toxin-antitoxin module
LDKIFGIFFFLVFFVFQLRSQGADLKKDNARRYTQAQVLDSTEGMLIYNKMMKVLEMDYELLHKEGSVVQGWNEEYYENGQLMHISYYKEGKLVLFKNFFENGQCQHYITFTDPQNCNMDVYFENGGLKNQVSFYNGQPKKLTEFFTSGLPKSNIEYDKDQQCISSRRTWFLNAETQSDMELLDAKEKRYSDKMYYPNGQIREEGELLYSAESKQYIKTGTWYTYESSGKKKNSEKYKVNLTSNR